VSDIPTDLIDSLRQFTMLLGRHVPADHIEQLLRMGLISQKLGGYKPTDAGVLVLRAAPSFPLRCIR
jgi:hypothetical protein